MDNQDKVYAVSLGCWLFCVLANLIFFGGVIWVAIHFISKYW